jgi:hypothetical protein
MNAIDANGVGKEIGTLVLSNIHKLFRSRHSSSAYRRATMDSMPRLT